MSAPLSEFDLIERFFSGATRRPDVVLGVGDDAALVEPSGPVAISTDTLVENVHFPADAPAATIGHRALAVNLSDLAAMGATPAFALLALTLPEADEAWLMDFSAGFGALARRFEMALIGGDTTRGGLAMTVTVLGYVTSALRRDGARPGDGVWVSGTLGDAGAGLRQWQAGGRGGALVDAFLTPEPRVALGLALRGTATAAIDISDGLLADAGHVCSRSGVGMLLAGDMIPLSPDLVTTEGAIGARELALTAGDDYELLFTAPADAEDAVRAAARSGGVAVARIGEVVEGEGVLLDGRRVTGGYRHFDGGRT